jgi:hypothetical protein
MKITRARIQRAKLYVPIQNVNETNFNECDENPMPIQEAYRISL